MASSTAWRRPRMTRGEIAPWRPTRLSRAGRIRQRWRRRLGVGWEVGVQHHSCHGARGEASTPPESRCPYASRLCRHPPPQLPHLSTSSPARWRWWWRGGLTVAFVVTLWWRQRRTRAVTLCKHPALDKRVLILVSAQASIHFAVSAFWFLWAPTIVADGRYAQLSVIYPCFLASRMLGSASFPWFYGATAPFRNEDSLTIAYVVAGLALSFVAYDYQEIGPLVILFCIFHACVGFILPSLARLRTMYLPNELRGGMMRVFLLQSRAPSIEALKIQPSWVLHPMAC